MATVIEDQAHTIQDLSTKVAKAYRARRNAEALLDDALDAIAKGRNEAALDLVDRALDHMKHIEKADEN